MKQALLVFSILGVFLKNAFAGEQSLSEGNFENLLLRSVQVSGRLDLEKCRILLELGGLIAEERDKLNKLMQEAGK